MAAIGLSVEHVVDEIDRRRGAAERGDGEQAPPPRIRVIEETGKDQRRENEAILEPLFGPQATDERQCRAGHTSILQGNEGADAPNHEFIA